VRAKLASGEMAVAGDQWPLLVYANQQYDPDDPWSGLFKSQLLIYASVLPSLFVCITNLWLTGFQTHIYLTQFRGERSQGNTVG
jgi:hypothetical protein